jgi:hypothetical protein
MGLIHILVLKYGRVYEIVNHGPMARLRWAREVMFVRECGGI